jgi:hypothetical protein
MKNPPVDRAQQVPKSNKINTSLCHNMAQNCTKAHFQTIEKEVIPISSPVNVGSHTPPSLGAGR